MKKFFSLLLPLAIFFQLCNAQQATHVLSYIEEYKELAILEQHRANIPAAIKLAQGILESGAGTSELSMNAANHFGIKCKHTWTGPTYTKDDDAKDECFRKYTSSHLSYKDHSDFLNNNKRYATLFTYDLTDYKSWAHGLKKAGYATNPKYAQKLIEVIENYSLNQYTEEGIARLNNAAAVPVAVSLISVEDVQQAIPTASGSMNLEKPVVNNVESKAGDSVKIIFYEVTELNGKKGFYAKKNDMLLQYAIKNKIRYAKLLEYNDFEDAPLPYDMFVYLEPKHQYGLQPYVTKEKGKTLHQISQEQGVSLASLRVMNYLNKDEEPVEGARLYLQNKASSKPAIAQVGTETNVNSQITGNTTKPLNRNNNLIDKKTIEQPIASTQPITIAEESIAVTPKIAVENNPRIAEPIPVAQKENEAPLSELDKLKKSMDQSVYGQNRQSRNTERPNIIQPGKKDNPTANDNISNSTDGVTVINEKVSPYAPNNQRNDIYYNSNAIKVTGNPTESLQKHMAKVKAGNVPQFVPKASGIEHTATPAPAPIKKKTTAKKKIAANAKKPAAKKTTTKKAPAKKTNTKKKK